MLKKFTVVLEFDVKSVDLLDVEVEAEDEASARQIAMQLYKCEELEDYNFYGSDYWDSTLDEERKDDWIVYEEEKDK